LARSSGGILIAAFLPVGEENGETDGEAMKGLPELPGTRLCETVGVAGKEETALSDSKASLMALSRVMAPFTPMVLVPVDDAAGPQLSGMRLCETVVRAVGRTKSALSDSKASLTALSRVVSLSAPMFLVPMDDAAGS